MNFEVCGLLNYIYKNMFLKYDIVVGKRSKAIYLMIPKNCLRSVLANFRLGLSFTNIYFVDMAVIESCYSKINYQKIFFCNYIFYSAN